MLQAVASVSESYSRYLELRSNPQCGAPLLRDRDTCEDALKVTLRKRDQHHLSHTKTITMLPESREPTGSMNYEHLEFNRFLVADITAAAYHLIRQVNQMSQRVKGHRSENIRCKRDLMPHAYAWSTSRRVGGRM